MYSPPRPPNCGPVECPTSSLEQLGIQQLRPIPWRPLYREWLQHLRRHKAKIRWCHSGPVRVGRTISLEDPALAARFICQIGEYYVRTDYQYSGPGTGRCRKPLWRCGPSQRINPGLKVDICAQNCGRQSPGKRFVKYCLLFGSAGGCTHVCSGAPER